MQHEVAAHARVKRANHTVGGAVTAQAAPTELEVWFTENRILLENYYLPGDLFQTWPDNPAAERKDQTPDYPSTPVAAPTACRVTSSTKRARASLNLHCSLSQKL
jgi:hypothetical protein